MRNGSTSLATVVRETKIVGAGGLLSDGQVSSDGRMIVALDTAGPHIREPGSDEWVRAIIPGVTVAVADFRVDYGVNTFAVAISWSNSSVAAFDWGGYVWIQKTGASTFTPTAFPRHIVNGNSNSRVSGKPMAFDPANPNVLWYGNEQGVHYSLDQGDNWTSIPTSTLPLASSGGDAPFRYIILFDRSSTVTGTGATARTQGMYVFVPGSGWYRSTNAGSTWALIAGSAAFTASKAKVHPTTGLLISAGFNGQGSGQVNIWNGTSWSIGTRIDGGGNIQLKSIEFHPTVAGVVYGIQDGGAYGVSVNNGATWGDLRSPTQTAATVDIPWHVRDGTGEVNYRTANELLWNSATNSLWIMTGIGAWELPTPQTTVSTSAQGAILLNGRSRGIENMVCTTTFASPDGKRAIIMQDKQCMLFGPQEIGRTFTDNYGPRRGEIIRGCAADYAPEDTDFWVASYGRGTHHLAFTENLGRTWTERPQLKTLTGGNGSGQVVVLSKDIWLAGQIITFSASGTAAFDASVRAKNALYLTRDRGLTWTEVVIGNGNATCAQTSDDFIRISLCKDPYTPGRVFFYNPSDTSYPNSADSIACRGIWMIDVNLSSNVAPTVTRLRDTRVWPNTNQDNCHLKLRHGGQANTFLLAGGDNAPRAYRGVVSGTTLTLTELTGTDNLSMGTRFGEVHGISAGKGRNGSSTPTIVVAGYRVTAAETYDDGINFAAYGAWESSDSGTTWTRLEQFPANAPLSAVENGSGMLFNDALASMHKSGELTVTTGGQGSAHRFERYERPVS